MASTSSETKYSEPEYAKTTPTKKFDVPYYTASIDNFLVPATQQLLETYSGIPRAQQSKHVHEIRDKAWAIRAYPCTGLGAWLAPYIYYSPAYETILTRLRAGERLLDIGCHVGSDMRRLVADGAPSDNMYALDIVSHWEVGFKLYRDRDRFRAKFIEASFLSDEEPALMALRGTVDIISISAVLHQWGWDDQVTGAKKLVVFSKPGTLVVGHQIGHVEAHAIKLPGAKTANWAHNADSFEKLWKQVGEETQTVWKADVKLVGFADVGWDPEVCAFLGPNAQVLIWVITRIS